MQFINLLNQTNNSLHNLHLPLLILQRETHRIVPPSTPQFIYHKLPSPHKQIFYFPHSKHHLSHDPCAHQFFHKLQHFLKKP
ncbi:serine aminopeptidase domain-containing protein, partial [Bacillus sp. WP8]|uniref:serine aminopeptidase domain-containing protein n=1 Tax=Bacillus sp. WP8 TaxID=756828 RepID=UPI0037BEA91D